MEFEFKPCPFCGFKQEDREESFARTDGTNGEWAVYCERCHTTGPMRQTRDSAIIAWNERFDG